MPRIGGEARGGVLLMATSENGHGEKNRVPPGERMQTAGSRGRREGTKREETLGRKGMGRE